MVNLIRVPIFLLLKDDVSSNDLETAQSELEEFKNLFCSAFGEHHFTPNFHDLDHIVESVRRSGPLWQFSGFNFEHVNGLLKRMGKGNKRIDKQILSKMHMLLSNHGNFSSLSQESMSFIHEIDVNKNWKPKGRISDNVYYCGKLRTCSLPTESIPGIERAYSVKRVLVTGKKTSTRKYDIGKRFQNSVFIKHNFEDCMVIEKIFVTRSSMGDSGFIQVESAQLQPVEVGIFKSGKFKTMTLPVSELFTQWIPCSRYKNFFITSPSTELY